MNLINDEELTIKICKFAGPLVLFIISPLSAYFLISVSLKEFSEGAKFDFFIDGPNILMMIAFFLFGIWMCRKGYGWFGGKK